MRKINLIVADECGDEYVRNSFNVPEDLTTEELETYKEILINRNPIPEECLWYYWEREGHWKTPDEWERYENERWQEIQELAEELDGDEEAAEEMWNEDHDPFSPFAIDW